MPTCRIRRDCRLCGGTSLRPALSLAPTPPANDFQTHEALDQPQEEFPLEILLCDNCGHTQLAHIVDPESLFSEYVYVSGTSPSFVAHFESYAATTWAISGAGSGDLVVDIGSNDGTLLKAYQALGAKVRGIDPARKIAQVASEAGIPTQCAFFSMDVARSIREEVGHARIITANNVCAHIDDLEGVIAAISELIDTNGIFAFEVSYLLDVINKTLFDTIYHEHLDYHAITPLIPFLKRHGLTLFHAEKVASHGGSIRIYAAPEESGRATTGELETLLEAERTAKLFSIETFQLLSQRIEQAGQRLRETIADSHNSGRKIAGYGAPAKATTLMHQFGLGRGDLAYIVDDSPWKQGLFSPGLGVPVVPASHIEANPVDDLIILAWNFAEPIIENNRAFLDNGGRFIVPLPELQVVTSNERG